MAKRQFAAMVCAQGRFSLVGDEHRTKNENNQFTPNICYIRDGYTYNIVTLCCSSFQGPSVIRRCGFPYSPSRRNC